MSVKDYSSLARDDNRIPVPTGTGFLTTDGAKASPYTVPDGNEFSLDVPAKGAEVVLRCDEDLRVSTVSGADYYMLPAGTIQAFSLGRVETLYLQLDSAIAATLNYYFVTV